MKILSINCSQDFSYFTKRGLNIEVTYDTCNKIFPPIKSGSAITPDSQTVSLYSPDVRQYLEDTYKNTKYDLIFFGWNPSDYGQDFKYTGGQTFKTPLSNGSRFATIRQGTPNAEIHEAMHIIGNILYDDLKKYDVLDAMDSTTVNGINYPYYKNNDPEAVDSNFAVTWNSYKKYLPELNSLNTMPTYKYFKPNEIIGLKPELVQKLDKARDLAGVPFIIDSGLRTPEHNATLPDAVSNSAHLRGFACDLRCKDSVTRFKMVNALQAVGFKRLGFGKNFIHADCDPSLPANVYWHYYK